jgi:ABC-type dipeptide/oligopeptide/nickel transport system ATPase component
LVGESGSGKSMTALSIRGLVTQPSGRIVGGRILFQGEDLTQKTQAEMQQMPGREICRFCRAP